MSILLTADSLQWLAWSRACAAHSQHVEHDGQELSSRCTLAVTGAVVVTASQACNLLNKGLNSLPVVALQEVSACALGARMDSQMCTGVLL